MRKKAPQKVGLTPGSLVSALSGFTFLILIVSGLAPPGSSFAQDFTWRARDAGLESVSGTNGVAIADYDRDGDLDIYFVAKGRYRRNDPSSWNRLFSNRGNGTFQDVTSKAGVVGEDSSTIQNPSGMGQKMGASWGDYNNDGWPDLFLTHFGPDQLYRNNADGTFSDITKQAKVAGGKVHLSSSALWFDYDLDGDLDLYVSTYGDYSGVTNDRRNRLYENVGNGEFLDVSETSGVDDDGATWTTVAIDADSDGHLDLYLANDFGPNKFYLNNGDKTFREKTAEFGLEDNFHGMGLAVTDCDRNGYFDIYLTNITEVGFVQEINPLFLNTGQNYFVNSSVEAGVSLAGWGWGTEFFDIENDGDEDLVVATGNFLPEFINELFLNVSESGDFRFDNISHDAGIADSTVARGVAVFDYDNDGDPDLLISNFFEIPSLYENATQGGHWLKVKLEGTVSNRDAFGTVVEVWAAGKSYKKYHHGAQFLAQNIRPLHFGLGDMQAVERIRISWPGGNMEEIENVQVNQTILIKENHGIVTGIRRPLHNRATAPDALRLAGHYPNPFNSSTQIQFVLGRTGTVELSILNLRGQIVKVSRETFHEVGEKNMGWDGTDWAGRPVSSGIYFYRLTIDTEISETGRMLLIK